MATTMRIREVIGRFRIRRARVLGRQGRKDATVLFIELGELLLAAFFAYVGPERVADRGVDDVFGGGSVRRGGEVAVGLRRVERSCRGGIWRPWSGKLG